MSNFIFFPKINFYIFGVINFIFVIFLSKSIIKNNFLLSQSPILFNAKKARIFSSQNPNKIAENFLDPISNEFISEKNSEKHCIIQYFALEDYPDNPNDPLIEKTKNTILHDMSKILRKNLTNIDTIFLIQNKAFGNTLATLNNIVFYCEILGCKKILLYHRYKWYIKNKIINNYSKYKTTIELSGGVNCNDINTICAPILYFLNYYAIIKPKIRFNVFKDEIKRNLPKVIIDPDDLYIHIRSGDIFNVYINTLYSQPPLCFYKKVLNDFKFKNIYLITQDSANPVISELLRIYPKIIYKKNSVSKDISLLSNAFNIIGSVSSFFVSIVKLNDNLKNIWEYNIYRITEKFRHLHHEYFDFPRKFITYTMQPSNEYKKKLFYWRKTDRQVKLMLNDKCPYPFSITEPNSK